MLDKLKRIADAPARLDVVEGWIANVGGLQTATEADVLTLRGEVAALRARLEEVITALTGGTETSNGV
jgi:hypothetical protein